MKDPFSLASYDFELPENQIAQAPVSPRDQSRLLVVDRAKGTWSHHRFFELGEFLKPKTCVVANNTKVIRARLLGSRPETGGKIEFLLLEEKAPGVWEGLCKSTARQKPGLTFTIPTPDGKGLHGTLLTDSLSSPQGTVLVEFDRDPVSSGAGELPLPPYIARPEARDEDQVSYQTVYSSKSGSAAAPTAGLHFTPRVMEDLRQRGFGWEEVTLHVGLGTFRPVKDEDIRKHAMHEERFEISPAVAQKLTQHRLAGNPILAVGTTTVRTLESAWEDLGEGRHRFRPGIGRTSIYIHPEGHRFQVVDQLLTNFHLPKSTLLMLVCAFAGTELTLAAYREAVQEGYRFFSYGDAMLLI